MSEIRGVPSEHYLRARGLRPKPAEPVEPRGYYERETSDEKALADARVLLAQAMEARCFVPIGPRHLEMLIALAERGGVA